MTKKVFLAALSYVVVSFAIAAPWHFTWFKDLYHELGMYNKAEPIMALGLFSMLIQGVVLAYIYPYFYNGGKPMIEGVRYGLIMGAFLFSVSTLANAAKIEVSSISTFIVIQVLFHFIQFGLAGAAIGLIYGNRLESRVLIKKKQVIH